MKQLEMTRYECATQISRVADDLRYHVKRVTDLVQLENRDQEQELTEEIEIRHSYYSIVELLKVMYDLM